MFKFACGPSEFNLLLAPLVLLQAWGIRVKTVLSGYLQRVISYFLSSLLIEDCMMVSAAVFFKDQRDQKQVKWSIGQFPHLFKREGGSFVASQQFIGDYMDSLNIGLDSIRHGADQILLGCHF